MRLEELVEVFAKLRAYGNDWRYALAVLFNCQCIDVRIKAAAFLLRYRTDECRAILEQASRGEGSVAWEASEVLERWKEGTWALDPEGDGPPPPPNPRKKRPKPG